MSREPTPPSRAPQITDEHLSGLRDVLDWYNDLPLDRFGEPLTLAILVDEFAMAARTILEPTDEPADPPQTKGLPDDEE